MTGKSRGGPSLIERLCASLANLVIGLISAVLLVGRQARKEISADTKAGGMFSPAKRVGRGATTGRGRGRGGPMGMEPKGTRPAGEDRDDWRDGDGDARSVDERIQDLRDAGYGGEIDADGQPTDPLWDGIDVPTADWGSNDGDVGRPESAEHAAFDGLGCDDAGSTKGGEAA